MQGPQKFILPGVGSVDAFAFTSTGAPELFETKRVDLSEGIVHLESVLRSFRREVRIEEAMLARRPCSVRAWVPLMAVYTFSDEDRSSLKADNEIACTSAEAAATADAASMESMSDALKPQAVDFAVGDRVRVARKSTGTEHSRVRWTPAMDQLIGRDGNFIGPTADGDALVSIDGSGPNGETWAWSLPLQSLELTSATTLTEREHFANGTYARVVMRPAPGMVSGLIGRCGIVRAWDGASYKLEFETSSGGVCWFQPHEIASPTAGLSVGTRVRVARKLAPYKLLWTLDMDRKLNECGHVTSMSEHNVTVCFSSGNTWTFAAASLDILAAG